MIPWRMVTSKTVLGNIAQLVPTVQDALARAEVGVIVTPWPQYAEIWVEWIANGKTQFIVDCWRQLVAGSLGDHCKIVHPGHRQETCCRRQAARRKSNIQGDARCGRE